MEPGNRIVAAVTRQIGAALGSPAEDQDWYLKALENELRIGPRAGKQILIFQLIRHRHPAKALLFA